MTGVQTCALPISPSSIRYEQLIEDGGNAKLDEVRRGLEMRDQRDMGRKVAPLKPAQDSAVIDTTGIDIEKVVKMMVAIVEERSKGVM